MGRERKEKGNRRTERKLSREVYITSEYTAGIDICT
jgi:hypothetical protein